MRRSASLLSVALLVLTGSFSYSDDAKKADNTPPEGYVALFNGKDLTNWKGLVLDPKKRAAMTPEELAKAELTQSASQAGKGVGSPR